MLSILCARRWRRDWESQPPETVNTDAPEEINLNFLICYLRIKDREYKLYSEFIIFIPFLLVFTISLLSGRGLFGPGYMFSKGIQSYVINGAWDMGPDTGLWFYKSWGDIGGAGDIYANMIASDGFLNLLPTDRGYVLNNASKLIGPIRVMQARTSSKPCPRLADFLRTTPDPALYKPCYTAFSVGNINKTTFGPPNACGTDWPMSNYSGWQYYTVATGFPFDYPGVKAFGGSYVPGWLANYPTDSGFFFDLHPTVLPESLTGPDGPAAGQLNYFDKLNCIFNNPNVTWIDDATRAVTISFFVYSPDVDLFTHAQLVAEITLGGSYIPSQRFNVFRVTGLKGLTGVTEIVTMVYVFYFLLRLVLDVWRERRHLFAFISSMWTWIELFNIVVFIVVYTYKIRFWSLPNIEFVPSKNSPAALLAKPLAEQQYWLNVATFERLNAYSYRLVSLNGLNSLNGLLCYFKIFKYFGVNPHFSLLTQTMSESKTALLSLAMYLVIIMIGFSMMALLLYSNNLDAYRSMSRALETLFRIALGDFDYASMNDVDPVYSPVFFYLYILIVWLLCLNMVIGILADGFATAKERQEESVLPVGDYLKQKSALRSFLERFQGVLRKLNVDIPANPKSKSPISWNRICGIDIGLIVDALEAHQRDLAQEANRSPAEVCITKDELEDLWRFQVPQLAKAGKWIAAEIFALFASSRESIHTAVKQYDAQMKEFPFSPVPQVEQEENHAKDLHIESLTIIVVEARNLVNLDTIGLSDPYVQIQIGPFRARTNVIQDDLNPVWNETFDLGPSQLHGEQISFTCFDKDPLGSELIGRCKISLRSLHAGVNDGWHVLEKQNENRGDLHLTISVKKSEAPEEEPAGDTTARSRAGSQAEDAPVRTSATIAPHTRSASPNIYAPPPTPANMEFYLEEQPVTSVYEALRLHLQGLMVAEPFLRSYVPKLARHIHHFLETSHSILQFTEFQGILREFDHRVDQAEGTYAPQDEEDELEDVQGFSSIQASFLESHVFPTANDWQFSFNLSHLLPDKFGGSAASCFPQDICKTEISPDIVVWTLSRKRMVMVQVVPESANPAEAIAEQRAVYASLLRELQYDGWEVHVYVKESGSGIGDPAIRRFLKLLGKIREAQSLGAPLATSRAE